MWFSLELIRVDLNLIFQISCLKVVIPTWPPVPLYFKSTTKFYCHILRLSLKFDPCPTLLLINPLSKRNPHQRNVLSPIAYLDNPTTIPTKPWLGAKIRSYSHWDVGTSLPFCPTAEWTLLSMLRWIKLIQTTTTLFWSTTQQYRSSWHTSRQGPWFSNSWLKWICPL